MSLAHRRKTVSQTIIQIIVKSSSRGMRSSRVYEKYVGVQFDYLNNF